jgi:hypothetical protein
MHQHCGCATQFAFPAHDAIPLQYNNCRSNSLAHGMQLHCSLFRGVHRCVLGDVFCVKSWNRCCRYLMGLAKAPVAVEDGADITFLSFCR